MDSKERVRKTIARECPDHVPLGMYAIDCDTVEHIIGRKTYFRDKVRTQIALWEGRRDELTECLKVDAVELFEKLDCVDLISFKDAMILPPRDYEPLQPKKIAEDMWEDHDGNVYKASYLTNDMTLVRRAIPFREYTVEEFLDEPEITPLDPSVFEVYDHVMDRLSPTRYVAGIAGSIVGMVLLGGMENGLMHYVMSPDVVRVATARAVKVANQMDDFYLHDRDDGVLMEQDQATTQAPMISPAVYRALVLPAMKERIAHVKSFGNKQILFHCCGNTWKLLDMFVEAGIQCYQSLQTACMDIRSLKESYGDRLCFWGGVAVEHLVGGTPEDVRKDVRYALQYGAPGGGFILGPSHSIAYGTGYDNFMAMLDEHDRLKDRF